MNSLLKRTLMAGAVAALGAPLAVQADPLENLPYALSGGTPNLDARLRYETVDQERPATITEDASATTLRSRLGYTTGKWNGVDGQLEFENLSVIGDDQFNSTENKGKGRYPVIADPEGSELNQAWIRYAGPAKTTLKFGRQRIIFDNARFIGNVGWRQREQTYDGVLLTNSWLPQTTLSYAYLANVNSFRYINYGTATAPDNRLNRDLRAHLVNFAYAPSKALNLVAYDYMLDFEADVTTPAPPADQQTLGLRITGTIPSGDFKFSYAAEYADQSDYADAPSTVDAEYWLAELGAGYKAVGLKLGYEVLGGDGVYAFQTPLATLHAFQGWADLFLVTPANGIKESYVALTATVEKIALMARYSDFAADEVSRDYGSEIDLQATRPFNDQLSLGLKYAAYSGESDAPVPAGSAAITGDVDKFWAWLEYKF